MLFRAVAFSMLTIFLASSAGEASGTTKKADLLLSHALSLRTSFAFKPELVDRQLALLPQTKTNREDDFRGIEPTLWRLLMQSAVIKIGYLNSPTPVVLYYNPIVDVAVLTVWQEQPRRYDLIAMRALPGEHLANKNAKFAIIPDWRVAEDPLSALQRASVNTLNAFRQSYPLGRTNRLKPASPNRADRVASQEGAEIRLLNYLIELTEWIGTPIDIELRLKLGEAFANGGDSLDKRSAEVAILVAELGQGESPRVRVTSTLHVGGDGYLVFYQFPQLPGYLFIAAFEGELTPRLVALRVMAVK